ncbi:MAG TPA: amidophosphoribosyltransferase [Bacillota bacterium]|nr:amidophosphoribosyltransferase [Bacillota bacterium]
MYHGAIIGPKLKESCGVCGGFSRGDNLPYLTCFALYALQHRGQESAGIAVGGGGEKKIWLKRGMGLVSEVFPTTDELKERRGNLTVGHVRYSYGEEGWHPENAQPLLLKYRHGELAIAHNGLLLNGPQLREELEEKGAIFQTGSDSELLAHLVARQGSPDLEESLAAVVPRLAGAFAFVLTDGKKVIGLRDRHGFRPLSLAALGNEGYFLASETCAFDTIRARFLRDVEPGEMVVLDQNGLRSRRIMPEEQPSLCIFEFIYFARPDSNIHGVNVHLARRELGRTLAREHPAAADMVTGVPDSSIAAASGYAEEAGLPYEMALVKNRYIGRTFIQPSQKLREEGVDLKLNAVRKIVEGKRVVIVDDSIVRGTTSLKLVRMVRRAGAREVHLRISSPPVIASCFYGIDTPTQEELIAHGRTPAEVAEMVGADSIGFLSHEGMISSIGLPGDRVCQACFTARYPVLNPVAGS